MFYESVPITREIGTTCAEILNQYGIDHSRFSSIIALPENQPLRSALPTPIGLHTQLPPRGVINLPINTEVTLRIAEPCVDLNGLRPVSAGGTIGGYPVSCFTHGIKVKFKRTGRPCNRIRWVQTITKQHDHCRPHDLHEFVDIGGEGFPWYHDSRMPDPVVFDDTPCGPAALTAHSGLKFRATLSIVVWTQQRITLIKSFTYGFWVEPGNDKRAIRWNPYPMPASELHIREHLRILRVGVNQDKASTNSNFKYNPTPPEDIRTK